LRDACSTELISDRTSLIVTAEQVQVRTRSRNRSLVLIKLGTDRH